MQQSILKRLERERGEREREKKKKKKEEEEEEEGRDIRTGKRCPK